MSTRDGAALAGAAAAAAGRLREWLLRGPAQVGTGAERGGVAGQVDAQGQVSYVYGEITGYYLHWLSGLPASTAATDARIRANAANALAWVARRYADQALPPTRIYLAAQPEAADWRNHVQFCFDLAMLAGGLARAELAALIPVPEAVWRTLARALKDFIAGDALAALPVGTDARALPQRWSTLGGPFLAKAGSRIAFVPPQAGFGAALHGAAANTRDRVAAAAAEAPVEMLHPTLYALEGALCAPNLDARAASAWLGRVLAFDPGDGQLPEAPDSSVPRSDVIAQALRVALLLRARAAPGAPDGATLDRLAAALLERVRDDGSIAFRPDVAVAPANVWCAMFAEQALRWYAQSHDGDARGFTPEDLV